MIPKKDYNKILRNFPNVELSYEKNFYKKVLTSNIYITIPKGRKYFAWFYRYKNENVCILLELNKKKDCIESMKVIHSCFDKYLCSVKGTIIYGTCFHVKNQQFFNIEDIFYFKGINIMHYDQFNKIQTSIKLVKKHLSSNIYTKNTVVFGIPIMNTNHGDLINQIKKLSYDVYFIQHRLLFKNRTFLNERINVEKEIFANFLIRPTVTCDIYDLYLYDKNELINYDVAYIPNYKTSVFMNSLFRKIKENVNLDALEESDDEDEFENVSEDKFVYLDKFYTMKCVFLHKFKKWRPLSITYESVAKKSSIMTKKYN